MRAAPSKALNGAPHETFLVIDSTNGQNALAQAREFKEALDITGIVLTKLDGTAKGGVVLGICDSLRVPVEFVGMGEGPDDLHPFIPQRFVDALLGDEQAQRSVSATPHHAVTRVAFSPGSAAREQARAEARTRAVAQLADSRLEPALPPICRRARFATQAAPQHCCFTEFLRDIVGPLSGLPDEPPQFAQEFA